MARSKKGKSTSAPHVPFCRCDGNTVFSHTCESLRTTVMGHCRAGHHPTDRHEAVTPHVPPGKFCVTVQALASAFGRADPLLGPRVLL